MSEPHYISVQMLGLAIQLTVTGERNSVLEVQTYTLGKGGGRGATISCHLMLTENVNFVTNALRGDV